jgi:hypothetical protein
MMRRAGNRLANWNTKPILRFLNSARASSGNAQMSVFSTITAPWVGRLSPPIIAMSDDLPEPERPTMAANCPRGTVRSMPLTATMSPRSVA